MQRALLAKMSTEANARAFFSSPYFAVVGASSNPAKFGHKSKHCTSHDFDPLALCLVTRS